MEALRSPSVSAVFAFRPSQIWRAAATFRIIGPLLRNHNAKQPGHVSVCIS